MQEARERAQTASALAHLVNHVIERESAAVAAEARHYTSVVLVAGAKSGHRPVLLRHRCL